ncbi:MAG: sulfurtransferase TusA family protein [Clostridiaceae bacterium]
MLDVKGLSCPEPLLLLKEELKNSPKSLEVVANEAHTVRNIVNFAEDMHYKTQIRSEGNDTYISLTKE